MLTVTDTAISAVKVLLPKRFGDGRGFFSETYNKQRFAEVGVTVEFVQDNHSHSARTGTIRGLHFQSAPFAQDKLVRVTRGRIIDVAVDLRHHRRPLDVTSSWSSRPRMGHRLLSPSASHTASARSSRIRRSSTKYPITTLRSHDHGVAWDDPALGIQWPVAPSEAVLSDKDRQHPVLADLPLYFD